MRSFAKIDGQYTYVLCSSEVTSTYEPPAFNTLDNHDNNDDDDDDEVTEH